MKVRHDEGVANRIGPKPCGQDAPAGYFDADQTLREEHSLNKKIDRVKPIIRKHREEDAGDRTHPRSRRMPRSQESDGALRLLDGTNK